MRKMFYRLVAELQTPDTIIAALDPLCGYDSTRGINESEPPMFKGIPMIPDQDIPDDQIHFKRNGELVGILKNIS